MHENPDAQLTPDRPPRSLSAVSLGMRSHFKPSRFADLFPVGGCCYFCHIQTVQKLVDLGNRVDEKEKEANDLRNELSDLSRKCDEMVQTKEELDKLLRSNQQVFG